MNEIIIVLERCIIIIVLGFLVACIPLACCVIMDEYARWQSEKKYGKPRGKKK